ncbi:MAG TPA: hypothetical protein VFV01_13535 [Spirillospora sp.]|nr:hypothetical protein [Spirillospora sp.]
MASEVIPDRATALGERVRRRLTRETTIRLTTVGRDGTPQPNPVGFLWDGGPAVTGNPAWLEKYGEAIDARFGSAAAFAERFSVPVRIRLTRVRG